MKIRRKLLVVRTAEWWAGALFTHYGFWACARASVRLRWLKGMPLAEVHLELLRLGAKWEWRELREPNKTLSALPMASSGKVGQLPLIRKPPETIRERVKRLLAEDPITIRDLATVRAKGW